MQFELPKEKSSIIKVIGVGGGGSNAVNYMFQQGIKGVDFVVCNTDSQALDVSPVSTKIQLGLNLTEGLGAGAIPDVGKNSAIETIEEIRKILMNNTKMVFITAGMGGGTGTGAAPIIASVAKEMGILTVGIVTLPFAHEGKRRRQQAEEGIEQLKKSVDTLLVISNDKLREIYGNLKLTEAFVYADNVLTTAAKSIAEIITVTLHINVDFADIQTVMKDSGVAIMGSAQASGPNRSVEAVEKALNSPLLNDNNIVGARYVLLNVVSGKDEITMDEYGEIMDYVQNAAGQTAEIIKGYGIDENLGDNVSVTIIATGFNTGMKNISESLAPARKVIPLMDKIEEAPMAIAKEEARESIEPLNPLEPTLKVMDKVEVPTANHIEVIENKTEEFISLDETKIEDKIEEVDSEINIESESFESEKNELNSEEEHEQSYIIAKSDEEVSMDLEIYPIAGPEVAPEKIPAEMNEPYLKKIAEPIAVNTMKEPVQHVPPVAAEKTEQEKVAQERIMRLKALSAKIKSSSALAEMEREPAYKRREVKLDNPVHSSESEISRFTLSTDDEKNPNIKPNNSFLHDNVD